MAEAVGMNREESMGFYLSMVLLATSVLLTLLQVPAVIARTMEFSPWIYVPGLLAWIVGTWQKQDHIAWLAIAWLSIFFMIDVYYGTSFF